MTLLNDIYIYILQNITILDIGIFFLILFINLIFILILNRKIKKIKTESINSLKEKIPINIEIDIAILEIIINNYKINKYDPALENIRKYYGITAENKYISIKEYIESVNELRHNCTLEIVNDYISKPLRYNLNKYFTDESLLLYIINKFVEV